MRTLARRKTSLNKWPMLFAIPAGTRFVARWEQPWDYLPMPKESWEQRKFIRSWVGRRPRQLQERDIFFEHPREIDNFVCEPFED